MPEDVEGGSSPGTYRRVWRHKSIKVDGGLPNGVFVFDVPEGALLVERLP